MTFEEWAANLKTELKPLSEYEKKSLFEILDEMPEGESKELFRQDIETNAHNFLDILKKTEVFPPEIKRRFLESYAASLDSDIKLLDERARGLKELGEVYCCLPQEAPYEWDPVNVVKFYDLLSKGNIALNGTAKRLLGEGIFGRASVVVWEPDIFRASQRGAEVFLGKPADKPLSMMVPPMMWLFNGQEHTPIQVAEHGPQDIVMGLFIFPTAENDGFGVLDFSLVPGSFEITITAGSLAYIQKWGEPVEPSMVPIWASLRFMDMEFVGMERAHLPRLLRRKADLGRRPPLPEVNVIRIRRTAREEKEKAEAEAEGRAYSCRWMVGSHWRNQWYPSTGEWKPVYIQAYVKGPEDAPFREKRGTVYHACR